MILSIHTCGMTGSVALGRVLDEGADVKLLGQAFLEARAYAAQLNPSVAALLARERATIADIEAIAVVRGPGSFTGIRVGLSAAKGMAHAEGIPLIALSRLELIAKVSGLPHVIAVVDAGRGDYYGGEYRDGYKIVESLLNQAELAQALGRPGAGVLVYEQGLEPKTMEDPKRSHAASSERPQHPPSALAPYHPLYVQPPDAADALRCALSRFRACSFEDLETVDANYLRRPNAEVFNTNARKAVSAT